MDKINLSNEFYSDMFSLHFSCLSSTVDLESFSHFVGVQGWRSGESTRLPPMWPGFDSQIRRQMWVEFVGSLLCTERFTPGTLVSPLCKKTKFEFDLIVLIVNLIYSVPN